MSSLFDMFAGIASITKKDTDIEASLKNIVHQIYLHSDEKSGPWIAGGMGRQLSVGEQDINDVDVWFNSKHQHDQVLFRLENVFGGTLEEKFSSTNATTYRIGDHTVQLIKRKWYDCLQSVFDDFDFTCCQIAVNSDLIPYGPGIQHAQNRILKLNRYDNTGFLARYAKYVSYGYTMDTEEFLDILNNEDMNYEFDGAAFGY